MVSKLTASQLSLLDRVKTNLGFAETSLEYRVAKHVLQNGAKTLTATSIQSAFETEKTLNSMQFFTQGHVETMLQDIEHMALKLPEAERAQGVKITGFKHTWEKKLAAYANTSDLTYGERVTTEEMKRYLYSLATGAYSPVTAKANADVVPTAKQGTPFVMTQDRLAALEQRFADGAKQLSLSAQLTYGSVLDYGGTVIHKDYETIGYDERAHAPMWVSYLETGADLRQRVKVAQVSSAEWQGLVPKPTDEDSSVYSKRIKTLATQLSSKYPDYTAWSQLPAKLDALEEAEALATGVIPELRALSASERQKIIALIQSKNEKGQPLVVSEDELKKIVLDMQVAALTKALAKYKTAADWAAQLLPLGALTSAETAVGAASIIALTRTQRSALVTLMQMRLEEVGAWKSNIPRNAMTCSFHADPAIAQTSAAPSDFTIGNAVWKLSPEFAASGFQVDAIFDQGHMKAFDTKTDIAAAEQSCSLGNNAVQFGRFNRQSYRFLEDGIRSVVRRIGQAQVVVADLYTDEKGKRVADLTKDWKYWTLGQPGTFRVVFGPDNKPLVDRATQLVVMVQDGPNWKAELDAKHTIDWNLCKTKVAKSLPVPSERAIAVLWMPKTGKRSMSAWIGPNTYKLPSKANEFLALLQGKRVPGRSLEQTPWRTTVDEIEAKSGLELFAKVPKAEQKRLEASYDGFPQIDPKTIDCDDADEGGMCSIYPSERPQPEGGTHAPPMSDDDVGEDEDN